MGGPQTHTPQQITQAQLSPAFGAPAPSPLGEGHEQRSNNNNNHHPPPHDGGTITNKLSSLFASSSDTSDGRNVGFTPTSKLAAQHEKHQQQCQEQKPRPLYQFQVTKLRSWRTGYIRLLVLYEDSFVTLDPNNTDTPTETNRWKYTSLTEWLAMPKEQDTILLQVDKDKLKFSCHNVNRATVLTALLQCQDESNQAPASETIVFANVERKTRHGTSIHVSLHVKAYGIVEVHPVTQQHLQVYRYMDLAACSFTSPKNSAGIVLYFHTSAQLKSRLYLIHSSRQGGNGRSDVLTLMRENCEILGIPLQMEESIRTDQWLQQRRTIPIGPIATSWQVTKKTKRHDSQYVTSPAGWVGGIVTRTLCLTGLGYLVERDGAGLVSCRRLSQLFGILRHAQSGDLTLEYADGSKRTYTSSNRDALLVSILDAAATMGLNRAVQVSDVGSAGYCLASHSVTQSSNEKAGGLFQPISIPQYCLKRVHTLATQTYAYVSKELESLRPNQPETFKAIDECTLLLEACHEFNASVLPTGDGLPTGPSDKLISGSIGALWGLVGNLLRQPHEQTGTDIHNRMEANRAEVTCTALFQTLYRLSKTPAGYKLSAELTTLQESISLLWKIQDVFCKYWGLQVLNVLLSGLPKRDMETEYVNKSVILRVGGSDLVEGIVNALLEPPKTQSSDGKEMVSDLVIMVASDLLQSLLCSYHDTTRPEYFSAFISALADR